MLIFFFFFSSRRRHTRLQGDWSSDVCSSDLLYRPLPPLTAPYRITRRSTGRTRRDTVAARPDRPPDRKSTRLNSSHLVISYAVFCLKKKKFAYGNSEPPTLVFPETWP